MKTKIITVLAVLFTTTFQAQAELITIEIEAIVDGVLDEGNYLEGQISPGSLITGYYIYESTTPDSSPLDPVQGNYWHYLPPAGISLSVGGFDFQTDPADVEFSVFIRNNNPSGDDIYGVDSLNNLPLSNGTIVDAIYWSLKDHTANVFSSDALPTTAPSLDQWDENLLRLRTDRIFLIDAHVTSAIPEPLVAEIGIKPETLNLASKGKWITCKIWLPDDCNVANINPDTILLERRIKPAWAWFNEQQQVAMARFSRSELVGVLEPGEVELTVTGHLIDGTYFEGKDTIRVINKGRLRRRRVNSNSIVEDGIEYYIQTDKAVYNLGENVEILYRVTNWRDEEWRFSAVRPIMDILVAAKEGENFNEIWYWSWDKIYPPGPVVFQLAPNESTEFSAIWPQIDLNGTLEPEDDTQVPPGRYRISGVFYPTDSNIAVDITIVKRKS